MCFDKNESKIVINGSIPLSEYVEELEREEIKHKDQILHREIESDVLPEIRSVKRSIYFRPKFVVADVGYEEKSTMITYTIADQIMYLLDRAGLPELKTVFSKLSKAKRSQIERLLQFYRRIKASSFLYADMIKIFKGNGVGDPARYIMMLEQAGIIKRLKNKKQIKFLDVSKGDESAVELLIKNNSNLIGYLSTARRPPKKESKKSVEIEKVDLEIKIDLGPDLTDLIAARKETLVKEPKPQINLGDDLKSSYIVAKKNNPNITIEEFAKNSYWNDLKYSFSYEHK